MSSTQTTTSDVISRRRGVKLSVICGTVLVAATLVLTLPAHGQSHKGANFSGGLPPDILDRIVGACVGQLQNGITREEANQLLVDVIREEHAAANPGPGTTGFRDALVKIAAVEAALENLQVGVAAESTSNHAARLQKLHSALINLTKAWSVGPVDPSFYSTEPPKEP